MDRTKCPPDGDTGLRAAGMINALVEMVLGAGIMIMFAFILFVFVRTNFHAQADVPSILKAPTRHHPAFQARPVL